MEGTSGCAADRRPLIPSKVPLAGCTTVARCQLTARHYLLIPVGLWLMQMLGYLGVEAGCQGSVQIDSSIREIS
jgi:hypothetical protein